MKLELTTEQVNQVLNALAQQPYIQVHELIHTIQQQGQQQLQMEQAASLSNEHQPLQTPQNGSEQALAMETLENKNGHQS